MSHTDSSFYKVCGAVLGLLVLFTICDAASTGDAASTADAASTNDAATETTAAAESATTSSATEEVVAAEVEATEIKTTEATEATATTAVATTVAATTAAVEIPNKVKATVDSVCAACHVSGIANAPKYGDTAAWDARMARGLDAVTASAIAGIGAMPARGGSSLNDEEMGLAVQYMLTK